MNTLGLPIVRLFSQLERESVCGECVCLQHVPTADKTYDMSARCKTLQHAATHNPDAERQCNTQNLCICVNVRLFAFVFAGCCRVLQGVAGCCRVLQGVAEYCSVLQGLERDKGQSWIKALLHGSRRYSYRSFQKLIRLYSTFVCV